jgi:hypothetical protein
MPIPLDLYGEIITASGARYRWDANQSADRRPRNLSFRTKIGEGFSDASLQFARRIDQDYPDLNLVDNAVFTGADGSIAYEGRNSAMPRDLGDTHSISVTLAGWMAHAKDKKFQEIYVDRDANAWADMALAERVRLALASRDFGAISWRTDGQGLVCALPNQALGAQVIAESWYSAPTGVTVGKVGYVGGEANIPAGYDAARFYFSTTADSTGIASQNVLTMDSTSRVATAAAAQRYVLTQVYSNGSAVTPAAGAGRWFTKLAAYGNHGLTTHTWDATEPDGLYASDMLRDVAARWCPQFNTSGVQDTTYVVPHAAFKTPTFPFDAFLEFNKYHLWKLAIWENKTLQFAPYDLTDYDWEIRTDDPGVTFSPQGPSTEDLFNGVSVTYTDALTGVTDRLTPDAYSQLADSSDTNPWNQHGIDHWDELTLTSPTTLSTALDLGTAALADTNRAKTPGTISVRGYIRDRAGNLQPAWKPRAGDTISITNFPNDEPRLIVETDYDDETKSVRLSIDKPFAFLDAYLDRIGNALSARGLA